MTTNDLDRIDADTAAYRKTMRRADLTVKLVLSALVVAGGLAQSTFLPPWLSIGSAASALLVIWKVI